MPKKYRRLINYSRKRGKRSHFAIGDKVLKKDFRRKKRAGGALDPKWLGPYEVIKDIGKGLFLVKRCDNGQVDCVHGDHLKVFLEQIEHTLTHKASAEHKASYLSMKKHHTVKTDSTSHEIISEDLSGQDRDDIMQNEDTVPQNATGDATLKELLYSSSLLRLWRSGACTQRYEANEDDEYFDVSCKFAFQPFLCTITLFNRKLC